MAKAGDVDLTASGNYPWQFAMRAPGCHMQLFGSEQFLVCFNNHLLIYEVAGAHKKYRDTLPPERCLVPTDHGLILADTGASDSEDELDDLIGGP